MPLSLVGNRRRYLAVGYLQRPDSGEDIVRYLLSVMPDWFLIEEGKLLGTWTAKQQPANNACTSKVGNNNADNTENASSTKEQSMVAEIGKMEFLVDGKKGLKMHCCIGLIEMPYFEAFLCLMVVFCFVLCNYPP